MHVRMLALRTFGITYPKASLITCLITHLNRPQTPQKLPFLRLRDHHRHHTTTICNSYSSPETYDIAFSFRDFDSEVAFLLSAQQIHGTGPLSRFLEVGCGPARHSLFLSRATGAHCIALDSSSDMLEYAQNKAKSMNFDDKIRFVRGDMASIDGVPGVDTVDMAAILLGTLSHCLSNSTALQCFRNMHTVIRPQGLLVIELSHPSELFDGSFLSPDGFVDCWEVDERGNAEFSERASSTTGNEDDDESSLADKNEEDIDDEEDDDIDIESELEGKRVLVEYGRFGDAFDPETQILSRTVGLSLFDEEGTLLHSGVESVEQRQFTYQEIELLAMQSGWNVVGVYGDLNAEVELFDEEAYRMVIVLQKE